ncbi:MAG: tryptophan 7-halogenase [Gemmataceae bacterium]|nr:tryptophan 7-halogenase [Gemmataceae bacterium]
MAEGPVKRLVIVGGGPAGWMAAAYLNRLLKPLGATVTLMESVKLGTSGVGSASDPALIQMVRKLQINENVLVKQTSATYRLGTRFSNWRRHEPSYWHPFGLCGGKINDIDLFPFWLKSLRAGRGERAYWSYSLQALAAEQHKAPRDVKSSSPIMERGEYGLHLDPAALADLFRELATAEGVNHLFDDVKKVIRGADGRIDKLETKSGRALAADLYLDCTNDGVVVEKELGDPWVSWSPWLLCDRAVLLPKPRDTEMPPFVQSCAFPAGWVEQFPLSHRTACTYYYSSAHTGDDAAVRALLAEATQKKASTGEPRFMPLRVGRRRHCWVGNCVALGPAAGSIEPLVWSQFLLLVHSLESLVESFPDASCQPLLADLHNRRMQESYDTVRDFTLLHYLLSDRDEEPFWRDCRAVAVPDSLQRLWALHDEHGAVPAEALRVVPEMSYHHVFAGNGRLPRRIPLAADALDFTQVCDILGKMRAQNEQWLPLLPPHQELIKRLHRPEV